MDVSGLGSHPLFLSRFHTLKCCFLQIVDVWEYSIICIATNISVRDTRLSVDTPIYQISDIWMSSGIPALAPVTLESTTQAVIPSTRRFSRWPSALLVLLPITLGCWGTIRTVCEVTPSIIPLLRVSVTICVVYGELCTANCAHCRFPGPVQSLLACGGMCCPRLRLHSPPLLYINND